MTRVEPLGPCARGAWQCRILTYAVAAACLWLCGGCALVDENVPLSYAPNKLQQPKGAGDTRARGIIEIAKPAEPPLERNKENLAVIGAVRNGYGVHTASVVTKDSVSGWFGSASSKSCGRQGTSPGLSTGSRRAAAGGSRLR